MGDRPAGIGKRSGFPEKGGTSEYHIIDADSHTSEPPNVWQDRVPRALKDRAPKMITTDQGLSAWSFDGGRRVVPFNTAQAGLDVTEFNTAGVAWGSVRPASYDPQARVDRDGV